MAGGIVLHANRLALSRWHEALIALHARQAQFRSQVAHTLHAILTLFRCQVVLIALHTKAIALLIWQVAYTRHANTIIKVIRLHSNGRIELPCVANDIHYAMFQFSFKCLGLGMTCVR